MTGRVSSTIHVPALYLSLYILESLDFANKRDETAFISLQITLDHQFSKFVAESNCTTPLSFYAFQVLLHLIYEAQPL